jgi:hypothetical protein
MRFVKATGGWFLLVFLLTAPAWAPLTAPGWFQSHSGFLPVYHLNDLSAHSRWGWLPTLAAPADFWRGEGPLPYVLARLWLPLGAAAAIKLTLILALVVGPLALFLAVRRVAGARPALIAAVLFAYLPFTLTAVYQRGALGEVVLMALLPCLAWTLHRVASQLSVGRALTVILLMAALAWTQAGLALLGWLALSPLALMTPVTRRARRLTWLSLALGGALGLLSRFAWQGAAAAAPVAFADHPVYLFQLFSAAAGFGLSQPGWQDQLNYSLGLAPMGLALLAWWPAAAGAITETAIPLQPWRRAWALIALIGLAAAVIPLPLGGLLTYPWQTLGLVGLALCILAAIGVGRFLPLQNWPPLSICLTLIALAAYPSLAVHDTPPPPRPAPLAIYRTVGPETDGRRDGTIILADMVTAGELQAGQVVSVTLTWQALQPPDFDYNLYLHVLDADGQRWGQADAQPVAEQPMTQWAVGSVYTGAVAVAIDAAAPAPLHLAWGLYNWQTGARLPAIEAAP